MSCLHLVGPALQFPPVLTREQREMSLVYLLRHSRKIKEMSAMCLDIKICLHIKRDHDSMCRLLCLWQCRMAGITEECWFFLKWLTQIASASDSWCWARRSSVTHAYAEQRVINVTLWNLAVLLLPFQKYWHCGKAPDTSPSLLKFPQRVIHSTN